MSRTDEAKRRRAKRQTSRNGDRRYFAAVRKLRRHAIDEWQLKNNPEKFKKRLTQLTLQALKRQHKQEERDRAREAALSAEV